MSAAPARKGLGFWMATALVVGNMIGSGIFLLHRPPHGFVWAARARVAGLPVTGFDRYSGGEGQIRWRLLKRIPVMSASGPDVTRSGAGRLAGELLLLPSAALSPAVTWEPVDDDRARARVEAGGMTHTLTVTVGATGMLTAVTLPRWGNPGNSPFREHTFGAEFHAERRFEGFTLPSEVRAGWGYGTDRWSKGEFIRYTLDKAAFI